jgi:hypothetical protein
MSAAPKSEGERQKRFDYARLCGGFNRLLLSLGMV